MPRKVPCSICGEMRWRSAAKNGWTPPAQHVCLDCRREQRKPEPKFQPELRLCKQCGEVFEAQRVNQRYCSSGCREARSNWGHRHADVASAEERGYGKQHRIVRARWKPIVDAGNADCCLCGDPIEPGAPWHLDHTPDRTGYRGPAHEACNLSDGAKRGNQRMPRPLHTKACATCGSEYQTRFPKQAYCSVQCRPKAKTKPRAPKPPPRRECAGCGTTVTGRKWCIECGQTRNRERARNAYRTRVGIPSDAPLYDRSWRSA